MKKAPLFAAVCLLIAAPTIARAQVTIHNFANDRDPLQAHKPNFGENGVWGKGGGVFRFVGGSAKPASSVAGMGPQLPLLGFDPTRGGAPALQGVAWLNKTTFHPGEEILHEFRFQDFFSQKITVVFSTPAHLAAWLLTVPKSPDIKRRIVERYGNRDFRSREAFLASDWRYYGNGNFDVTGRLDIELFTRDGWTDNIIQFANPRICIPPNAEPGDYDLCVALTPNGFPDGAPLNDYGFPDDTYGWIKIRLHVE